MKKLTIFFLITIITAIPAVAIEWKEAESMVMTLPCKSGGTVDQCLNKKAILKVVDDLGWKVYPTKDGFDVERLMLLNTRKMVYRWHVSNSGTVSAINGKAIGIQKH